MQMVITPSHHHALTAQTLKAGERGMGTIQSQMSSWEKNGDQPGCGLERDKPPTPQSWMTMAAPVAWGRDKPPAHSPLQLRLAQAKLAWVLSACGQPEGGRLGSQVPAN